VFSLWQLVKLSTFRSGNWGTDCKQQQQPGQALPLHAESLVPSSGCPGELFSTGIFDLHGTIRRAFTESRTWNERPIAKTVPEAVGWSVPPVLASKQRLKEKALANGGVVDPSEGDAIHVRMLSASCPTT
jgi:hypothetical protein